MSLISTGKQIGKTIKNAGRLRTIVGVFARHGFHNIAERIKLGQFILEKFKASVEEDKYTVAERVRMCFEELGPTFVKLGQLLASRPDLVSEEFIIEFSKLHDQVQPLSYNVIEQVLKEELGINLINQFESIDPKPIGAASIAQVHKAKLKNGDTVVLKVQRPGIIQTINEDLNVLYFLAELLEKYVEETRTFNPVGIVDEYFRTLELETNFIIEANNIRRFAQNFAQDEQIHIPKVYFDFCTEKVLTMEELTGLPLSQSLACEQPGTNKEEIIKLGLRTYFKMVFKDGLFHGDLHAGNFFIEPNNRIGLIDFGVVGRLNTKTQTSIANMLLALATEDYERLAHEYVDLAPFNEHVDVDLFAKNLRDLIAPHFGLTLKNVNLGKILLKSSAIASHHKLQLPTELMLFFKSLVSVESLGKKIHPDFDFLQDSIQFAGEILQQQYDPTRMMQEVSKTWRDSQTLLSSLPRQLMFLLRKMNNPEHALKLQIKELNELRYGIEKSANLIFLGLIIGCLLLSSSFIYVHEINVNNNDLARISWVGYSLAGGLSFLAFFNYLKK